MANPERGEVLIRLADGEYTFVFTVNAICELEDLMGASLSEVVSMIGAETGPSITALRGFIWAGLRKHHPETTVDQAGEILGKLGTSEGMAKIGDALERAFPPDDGEKKTSRRKR